MTVTTLLAISLGAILTNNFIFAQFLGICPFLGVSKKIDTAVGMGAAVTFVMGLASAICYAVNLLLIALDLAYMSTLAFILVIAVPSLFKFSEEGPGSKHAPMLAALLIAVVVGGGGPRAPPGGGGGGRAPPGGGPPPPPENKCYRREELDNSCVCTYSNSDGS